MRHEAPHQSLALFRDIPQLRRKDERIPRGLHPFVGHTSPLVVVRACTRSFGSERLPPCDRARLINDRTSIPQSGQSFCGAVRIVRCESPPCAVAVLGVSRPRVRYRIVNATRKKCPFTQAAPRYPHRKPEQKRVKYNTRGATT